VLINIHTLDAARVQGVKRLLYTSSACVYPGYLQDKPDVTPLKEEDAYRPIPRTGMAGRSSTPSGCAVTTPRLRARDADGALPQHLRPPRDLRRWP